MGEFGQDCGIYLHVWLDHEDVDVWLDLPRELFENEVLILHLGAEPRGLKDALAVPLQRSDLGRRCGH